MSSPRGLVCAAIVPAAPALVPGLGGRTPALPTVHEAALAVLGRVARRQPDRVIVVAQGDSSGRHDPTAPLGLRAVGGTPRDWWWPAEPSDKPPLPVALSVGAALLREAGWDGPVELESLARTLAPAAARSAGSRVNAEDASTGLVLLGSLSARCHEKSPGSAHPDAAGFNEAVLAMVRAGDTAAMLSIDARAADEQLSDIRPPLQFLAGSVDGAWLAADVVLAEERSGVYYVCASVDRDEVPAARVDLVLL